METDILGVYKTAPTVRQRSRLAQAVAVSLAVTAIAVVGFYFARNPLLNRYVRPRLEQAFAGQSPRASLQLGTLHYDFFGNRLQCDGLEMTLPDGAPIRTGPVAVSGVSWARLLAGKSDAEQLLHAARIEIAEISARWPAGDYRVRCGDLRISIPDGEIDARALTYQPLVSDDAFFDADPFRRVRYRFAIAGCILRGVGFAELLRGQAYRVQSAELQRPVFDSFVDREKPPRSPAASPPMPHEILAAIAKPFRIDEFTITDGLIRCAGRRFEGAEPGVLVFTAVQIAAKEVANAVAGGRSIEIRAAGRLMDAGGMTVHMLIPTDASALTFHYSGKLGAMDLTRLDEYLGGTGRFEIKSGSATGASFDIDVVDGHARGALKGVYRDLQVKVLDRETGSEKGVTNRVATVLANQLKVRKENTPTAGSLKQGKIDYTRLPEDSFLQFAWLAVRSGITDLITL